MSSTKSRIKPGIPGLFCYRNAIAPYPLAFIFRAIHLQATTDVFPPWHGRLARGGSRAVMSLIGGSSLGAPAGCQPARGNQSSRLFLHRHGTHDVYMKTNRWFWALGFLLLFPVGVGMCMASCMSVEGMSIDGMNTRNRFNIASPTWLTAGIVVLACALLSLRGYIVRLKSDLRASRERKAEPPVTTQP